MDLPKRKLPRLSGYDYSTENYYFVTICTHKKQCLFGTVENKNAFGCIAEQALLNIPKHFPQAKIDKYVIMPNHIHGIVVLNNTDGMKKPPTLSVILGQYKAYVSKEIHQTDPDLTVWQTSFYDSIIRNEQMYQQIWKYIDDNPRKWQEDEYYQESR